MMKNLRRWFIFVLHLFLVCPANQVAAFPGGQLAQVIIQKSSDQGLLLEVQVPWQLLEVDSMAYSDSEYTQVDLPGYARLSDSGKPALPMLTEFIAVPFGVDLEINVTTGKTHKIILQRDVIPAVTQLFESIEITKDEMINSLPERRLEIIEDPEAYQGAGHFPGFFAEITNDGVVRQQRVVGLSFYPVQYDPQSKELTLYESLQIEIKFIGNIYSQTNAYRQDSLAYENAFQDLLLNYDESRNWRHPTDTKADLGSNRVLGDSRTLLWTPPNPGWRIKVVEDGFYKITYDELVAIDFPVEDVNLSTLQIFHMGSEIAVEIEDVGGDGDFNTGDAVVFFAQSLDNKYSQENIYWLTHGMSEGARLTTRDVTPDSENTDMPCSFTDINHLEKNLSYISIVQGEDSFERFMWTFLSDNQQKELPVVLPPIDKSASGSLKLALFGYNNNLLLNPDHRAIIYINGTQVADVVWDGRTWMNVNVAIPAGVLNSGDNSIKITNPEDGDFDAYYVDWVEITYERIFVADNNYLDFYDHDTGSSTFQISGFTNDDLALFDITDPGSIIKLTGFEIETNESLTSLIFQDEINTPKYYWSTSIENYLFPASIEIDDPSDLQNSANGADYILITHDLFADHLSGLRYLRKSHGLRVFQVDVQDIYDEFNFGITDAVAIRNFLSFAYKNWEGIAPSYVLLVGDGHYNPKNYNPSVIGFNRESLIPPYLVMVDPGIGETASDNRYVTFIGSDPLPDMMIGRLAVNSVSELTAFTDKILAYEGSSTDGDWRRKVLAVADNSDDAGAFPASSQNLLSCCLPDHYQAEKIFLGETHATRDSVKEALMSGINSGKVLINYLGHGAYSQWGGFDVNSNLSGNLLSNTDISGLTNDGKYPVILAMTCYDGFFHHPHPLGSNYESLAEVITKADGKGAIASFSPTGAGLAIGHDYLNQGYFESIFEDNVDTLGVATARAKLDLWATGSNLDLLDTFMLFGDPATNFARTLMAVNDAYQVDEDKALIITNVEEGVLADDINPWGASLSAILVDTADNGSLDLKSDGSFAYSPNNGFHGIDSFTYIANDGSKDSNVATVTITVNKNALYLYLPVVFR